MRQVIEVDEEIVDLFADYLENRRRDLACLEMAAANADWPEIIRIGHRVKGTAENYGLTDLGLISGELEIAASRGDRLNLQRLLAAWKDCVSREFVLATRTLESPVRQSNRWSRPGSPS